MKQYKEVTITIKVDKAYLMYMPHDILVTEIGSMVAEVARIAQDKGAYTQLAKGYSIEAEWERKNDVF